jgi:hypothetical protein
MVPVKIVSHNVGFRPGRAGGARLDLEELDVSDAVHLAPASSSARNIQNSKVACIQAYGIGPAGESQPSSIICFLFY